MNTSSQSSNDADTINLLDYWRVLVGRRRLIGIITGSAFVLSIIVSLLLPNIYRATSSVLPPQLDSPFGGNAFSQFASGAGEIGAGLLGMAGGSNDLWVGILESRTVRDAMIERFDLRELYGTKTIEDTRRALDGVVTIDKSRTEGIISISVEDKDPIRAAAMANAFVEELDRVNRGAVMTSGERMRVFVEERLAEAQDEGRRIEEAVRAFQETHHAVRLDEQSEAIIEAIGSVKGQLMAKEVELQTFLSYATRDNPRAEILQTEVTELKERMRELEEGDADADNPSRSSIFLPTDNIPAISMEYGRLVRDATRQATLVELLTLQYEMARIQEAKDSPTVQVLDVANPPEKRVKPKRSLIVFGATFFGAAVAVFVAFLLVYIERIRRSYA
ncbi:MAG: lipopolysaccharide biosynthesis protein [Candidatus Krumholzibacteriota bacterium]|nr:lipopolysaccharide biosynthesis protein [Candidatus Krumholzibacteriota bacterium]